MHCTNKQIDEHVRLAIVAKLSIAADKTMSKRTRSFIVNSGAGPVHAQIRPEHIEMNLGFSFG